MGPAKVTVPRQDSFLRKHHRDAVDTGVLRNRSNSLDATQKILYRDCCYGERKAALPPNTRLAKDYTTTSRNYVKFNKRAAQDLVPRKPKKYIVDTRNGEKQCLDNSGLTIYHVLRKEFGEVPQYLRKRKEAVEQALQKYNEYVKELQEKNAFYQIREQEKECLLSGLKRRWRKLFQQYQSLPVMMDTLPKIQVKLCLEKVLADLEKDIELIENFRTIYVSH
ncbi:unnamed protein product [Dicrocoelium dendriticum]|nr:unnamed protein product [Dicrocoelium dendriticum]